jgi:uncharacterized protein with HEPN domain
MRPEDSNLGFVWDMLDAAREAVSFIGDVDLDTYRNDHMIVRAVERCIQIVGEAANKVTMEFRAAHPEIPWQKAAAQRHVLVHDYGEIDQTLIWSLVRNELPGLIVALQTIIDKYPPSGD